MLNKCSRLSKSIINIFVLFNINISHSTIYSHLLKSIKTQISILTEKSLNWSMKNKPNSINKNSTTQSNLKVIFNQKIIINELSLINHSQIISKPKNTMFPNDKSIWKIFFEMRIERLEKCMIIKFINFLRKLDLI